MPELDQKKKALLARLLAREGLNKPDTSPIAPRTAAGPAPLSFAQRRLWLLEQMAMPGPPAYNMPAAYLLDGDLDVAALETAFHRLLQRHDILRTRIISIDGEPRQDVVQDATLALTHVDLSRDADPGAGFSALARTLALTPFDLTSAPMMRAMLVRLSPTRHGLAVVLHHIAADGWSLPILLREVMTAYSDARQGRASSHTPLRLQYADYADWHRALIESGGARAHGDYWKRTFADLPAPLDLPADFVRPTTRSFHGAGVASRIDTALTSGLRSIGRAHGASVFMTLMAAVNAVLARYSGQQDLIVGAPIAGRVRAELADQIGFYVNMLPLRTMVDGRASFSALLTQIARTAGAALEHEVYPFDQLVHELHLDRDLARSPLFDVVVVVDKADDATLTFEGLTVQPLDLPKESSKFDVTFHFVEHDDHITYAIEYSTDLFLPARIERLARHFEHLLRSLVATPELPLNQLSLVPDDERARLLTSGSPTTLSVWSHSTVAMFERHAAAQPEALAATCDGHHLTYGELNARANRIARDLVARGVTAESRVGVCMDRSLELVAAILGVLKAGGAYVPLDPSYPAERLQYLIADSGMSVVLTRGTDARARLGDWSGAIVDIDDLEETATNTSVHVTPTIHPEQAAYVIYTSGSTGQPKGCVVTHGNLARLMTATDAWYQFQAGDVWTLFHSYAFDFSVWELWGALAYGGRLVVVPYWISRDTDAFHALLSREHVTVLNQTPSAFRELIRVDAQASRPLALRYVIFGGEALDIPALEPWFRAHGDRTPQLVNMYGITETTVHVTYRPVGLAEVNARAGSVIGVPIPDLGIYVLDATLSPVPIGVSGEIYVGGAGVCRGYLGRAPLTAERFIPDPFSNEPGARLYRSGDLGRWTESGDIEYLGRADTQVKIRGFRIEIGEIEAALRAEPGVDDAMVIARTQSGAKQLIAYVVASEGCDVAALRAALARSLPDYMVPAHVVRIAARPLTANGKLDVRALPEPEGATPSLYAAPETDAERALCEVWADALGVARVGVDDNYFELGGDSILALRVIASARARGVHFGIRDLYQKRTVRGLTSADDDTSAPTPIPTARIAPFALVSAADRALIPSGAEDAYPLSRLQAGMFFHTALDPASAVFHDVFSYRLRAPINTSAFERAVTALAARHPMLRTSFHWDPYSEALQIVWATATVPITVTDLRHTPETEHDAIIARVLETEKRRAFDLGHAPLFRLHLHVRSDTELQLTADFHHAILDGWSFATLMSELVAHYLDLCEGRDTIAPAAPTGHFREFIALERDALQSADSRAFWTDRLAQLPATRLPRWPVTSPASGAASVVVDIPAGVDVQALAQRIGVPVKSACMAVHAAVLAVLSGDHDTVTGLTTNGRPDEVGSERVIGLFLNTVPFRLNVQRDSWRTLVERAFDAERELLAHRRFPLAEIKSIAGGRDLYDAGFNFVHFHVYKEISERVGVVDMSAFEETDYAFVANFSLDPRDGRLALRLSYDAAQFPAHEIDTIAGYYARALNALASTPDTPWHQHSLLSLDERTDAHLRRSRGPDTPAPDWTVTERFTAHVRATPDAIAVVSATGTLTYAELDERSERVARHLATIGIGPDQLVGIRMPRSEWLLVALLGTLKAGAAYVPIDVSYPDDRIAYILSDCQARVVLTDGSQPGVDITSLPATRRRTSSAKKTRASNEHASHLAYVIYTSGSTGRPKGTMVTRGGLAHYLAWAIDEYRISSASRSIVHSSVSFDATITSLLTPLIVGGTVELVPETHAVPALARALASDESYDLIKITPAHLDLLRHELADTGVRARVGAFVIGGEALMDATLTWWRRMAPGARFLNEYGPTETVVGCAIYEDRGPGGPAAVPIGAPIDRMQLYVLSRELEPIPTGTTGELFIGGAGVARGYLGRPDLTSERFVPDPFSTEPAARMYRTGDLARWRTDGVLEYLGRNDFQVKVRGHRVELGEIEAVLTEHPAISEAAVVARAVNGTHELIAFLVGTEATLESIRGFIAQRVPDPLVPAQFVRLASLPLTPNGKVDRAALLAMEHSSLQSTSTYSAPRTDVEKTLATIWEAVLHKTRIGVSDDYFANGGDSLKALQVVSRAAREGWRLRVRDVFDYPTIAELSRHAVRDVVRAEQGAVVGDVALTPIQRWFFEDHRGPYHHFNQSVMLRWRGVVDHAALERALEALADHHDALRMQFTSSSEGEWQQHNRASGVRIPVSVADSTSELDPWQASLDLASGVLARAVIIRGTDDDRVLVVMHHLIVDGVSWRVLLEDLDQVYQQCVTGAPVRLAPKTTSFREWSQRLAAYASTPTALSERHYWQAVVTNPSQLPADGPAEPGPAQVVVERLDAETTDRLLGSAHRAYRTQANDLLLTGLAIALDASFNMTRSLVSVEGHGRHDGLDADVSRTVGWFTSRYPVRLELAGSDMRSRIRRVKEDLRRVPTRGFGYGVLRYFGDADTAASLAAHPSIGFNYLGRFDSTAGARSFAITDEATGAAVAPTWTRDHDLEVIATVFGGALEIRVEATRGRLRPERVRAFADAYVTQLRAIAAHCVEHAGEPTPSDLTYTGLDITTFDGLLQAHGLSADAVEDILPLSPMQEGFLVHSLYEKSGAYFEQSAYRLNGRMDIAAFEEAWNQLLQRHPNLRVSYWHEDVPRPMQVVLRDRRVEFRSEDWRHLDDATQQQRLAAFRETERRRGFDLSRDPLVRVAVFEVGANTFDAVWSFPHLLLDGWSAGILLGELLTMYAGLVGATSAALPEPVPYRRYLQWLERQERRDSLDFWKQYLDGYDATASVPATRRSQPEYAALSLPWHLTAEDSKRLKALAADAHVTLSTVVQTLWATLLASYTERNDVAFGATVSGRPETLSGVDRMVGLFINTVPVRVQMAAGEGFVSVARRVQADSLVAQSHAAYPLAEIQAQSTLGSHLFDHILVFENYPLNQQLRELGSVLKVEYSDVFEQVHYDLGLLVADGPEHLALRFIANAAVYPAARLERVAAHFAELVRAVLANPDRPVRQHRFLPDAELQQLAAFNVTPGAPRPGVTLVDLLNEQAARTPNAVAIIHGNTRVTYAELQARTDAWARVLQSRGIGPEALVGVFVTRRVELIVALISVLKAGGAYVPLDPNYPADRVSFLLKDAQMALVLTERSLRSIVPGTDDTVLCVDEALPSITTSPLARRLDPHNLAYIIYTSGSTGTPKGTAIAHAAAAALVEWGRHTYSADELRGVLASTSVCFDLSVFEIFVTLSTGGAIILANNALELPSLPAATEVTLVNTVPSAMTELVRSGGLPASVCTVNLAGEPLPASLVDALYSLPTIGRVWDLYGPSEDTTYSTQSPRERGGPETIGGPLTHSHTEIYLLNARLDPVPIGSVGELYISSDKLCRGYLNRAGMTAERFLPNPWSRTDGGRMYRTGDLARYREDGRIEFLGRIDHQVKIRGFRIELGEIESVLTRTTWLRDAAVVAREDAPGDKRIVAYLVTNHGGPTDAAPYRDALAQSLPDYMMPAAFVFLDQLPLTPNGKLDRRALPAPDLSTTTSIELPRTELETMLAGLWRETLETDHIGIFDSFFDHGGHSLKAARMVSRARQTHGLDLSLRDLFMYPTIAALAEQIAARRQVDSAAIPTVPSAPQYAVSYGQRRLWVLEQLRGDGPAAYNVPAAFIISGRLNVTALTDAFRRVVARHEILRTRIVAHEHLDGEPQQVVLPHMDVAIDYADLSRRARPADAFDALVRELAHAPFDLSVAPLFRVAARKIGKERYGLAVVFHHIVMDGWSIPVLMRELMTGYRDAIEGRESSLAALPLQYRDFAAWQRSLVAGDTIAPHRNYWLQVFEELPTPLELPTDAARGAIQTFDGGQVSVTLDPAVANAIRTLAATHDASLFMTLLAAMKVLLAKMSGQRDITVGSPMAGRIHPDLGDQIGYYVNTVPLRTRLEPGEGFSDLLKRTREVVSSAYEHQEYPFDRLVEDLNIPRDLSRSPLFDVMVAMENNERADVALVGLDLTPLPFDYEISKFDLTTTFRERGPHDGIDVVFEFNTALFQIETIRRMAHRFETLVQQIVAQPGARVDVLPWLPADEWQAVVHQWNQEPLDHAHGRSLADLFEAQAAATPDADAVVHGQRRLTYRELNAQANGVAQALISTHGVRPEETVGVMVDASDHMIVGLLGILKAGCAYVPVDPAYPRERNLFVLADAGVRVVVKTRSMALLNEQLAAIDLDDVTGSAASVVRPVASEDALAYVLYTSGSTGQPKGVEVSHRGVINLLADIQRRGPVAPGSQCALWTSASFDVSVYEIFAALLYGGCLHITTELMRSQPRAYFEWLANERITHAYVAPFQLSELREFIRTTHTPLALSRLLVGVEPIDEQLLAALITLVPGLQIVNGYGPTETTVCATFYDVPSTAPSRITPIGRALANTGVYVVDTWLQPVGIGVVGEIVVAGEGLARGYHANAAATADAFVPNPFGPTPGTRLYRTGDLGRRLPDGNIVFAGRTDHQVKIRGHRVEIGEVERALRMHPSVLDTAVIARASGPTKELVAFLVTDGDEPSVDALRRFLEDRLPGHMIPARFVVIDALPLTPNGKIDRRALQDRDGRQLRLDAGFVAPRDHKEAVLTRVWQDVLGAERVGIHDNYFALGGDSIKAIQIAARAGADGLSLSIRDVFSYPTVETLAAAATTRTATIAQGPVTGDVPLTAIQEWFFRQSAPHDHFNQAVLLRWHERADEASLRSAVATLIEHHDALRLRVTLGHEGVRQSINDSAEATWTISDLRSLTQADAVAEMTRRADALHTTMQLTSGRLVAGALFRLPDADRVLLVIHHLVVDGVSWRILLEDLDIAYQQAMTTRPMRLPAKTESFKTWAIAAREAAASPRVQSERAYWATVCAGTAVDTDTKPASTSRETVTGTLSTEDTRTLLSSAGISHGADTISLLLTALAAGLRDGLGRTRTIIDLEGHGRESVVADIEVGRTVGWFTSLYPFALDAPATDLRTSIEHTRAALHDVPNHGVGYGLLRYLSTDARSDLDYRADVGFNYLGQFDTDGATRSFGFARESSGAPMAAAWHQLHAIDISAHVEGQRLQLACAFDPSRITREHAQKVLDTFARTLNDIATLTRADADAFAAMQARVGLDDAGIADTCALSPMQEGMLFSALFNAGSDAYFEQIAYRISGHVDPAAFEATWNTLLERHANLRSSVWHSGIARPTTVVRRSQQIELRVEDWSNLDPSTQQAKLHAYRIAERRRGFDLERDRLMRFGLFKTAASTWDVVWSYPHLLLDGWSTGILIGEFLSVYAGEADTLAPVVPYTRYLDWIASQQPRTAIDRWRHRLADYEDTASVPADVIAEASTAHVSRQHVSWTMPGEVAERLATIGARHGITMNTVVQTLWGLLLGRLTDRTDVVFGATVSGRPESLAGVERMVGLFINTLPVRVQWQESESFAEIARRIQQDALACQADGFVPLADIQAASPARGGLFDHLLIFENYPIDERVRQMGDARNQWTIDSVEVFEETHYPLVLSVAPSHGRFEFRCAFDPATYSRARIERLKQQWDALTATIVNDADASVAHADILLVDERRLVLDQFAHGSDISRRHESLIALLDETLNRAPDSVAVVSGTNQVTLRELHARADRLASMLVDAGVGTDTPVALCLERSIDLVIGMLGIIKAGGAYVPMDPEYPEARLRFMLDDCRVRVVVTTRSLFGDAIATSVRRVFVDELAAAPASAMGVSHPESLAYVLYTSGSTGTPKGVGIPHSALANHMRWMARTFPLGGNDRVLQKTPFSFDASVWEFWAPLVEGATLVMAAPGVHQDPRALAAAISVGSITVLQVVPTMLHALLDEPAFSQCTSLQRVFVGGEALTTELRQRFFATLPSARLVNLYGPTETTIDATWCECHADDTSPAVPIGTPVDGLIAYVFDQRMKPSAVGVWGELFIGGDGVGRGYINRPDLTADRFCPDPVSPIPGARLYRTGDRARWRDDGLLEYGGRADDQVKLRGFRIELGEIESALKQLNGVADAAALVVGNGTELCAYLVARSAPLASGDVRQALRDAGLPPQMIPGRIVFMDALPRTTSGKLDRRALRGAADVTSSREHVAPRTDRERALSAIWAQALQVPAVGIHDNFFDLGGHSLTAARVAAHMSRDLSVTISVRDVFTYPTIAELASYLTAVAWVADTQPGTTGRDDDYEDVTL